MERKLVQLPWGMVSYLEWLPDNQAEAATLLLLHGGGLDSAELSWGGVGPALATAGYRVLAPDHPGYGESPPAPWTAVQERLVDYVGELVTALGLGSYAIGGLSLGGGMAIGHVLQHPRAVTGVVLLGSYGLMDYQFDGWFAKPAHVITWLMVRTGMMNAVMSAYAKNRKWMASSVRNIIRNPEQRTPELLDAIMRTAAQGAGLTAFGQWQRDQFLWNRLKTSYTDRLESFPRRVLMIHGDHDSGVPLAYVKTAAERIPEVQLVVIPNAGHWVQRDRPDLVLPALTDFLKHMDGTTDATPPHPASA